MEEASSIINGGGQLADVKLRRPYNDLIAHFTSSYIWKAGDYTGKITVLTKEGVMKVYEFTFKLNAIQITLLKDNIHIIEDSVAKRYAGIQDDTVWHFNWVNPIQKAI